jgi:ABC-type nitrate/sulfonate/bicarbonate transport system ATPase subunit
MVASIQPRLDPSPPEGGLIDVAVAPALVLDGVGKRFPSGASWVEALRDVNLSIGRGEFICLVGASGCGKSTLLRIMAGFEVATSGTVRIGSEAVKGPGPDRGVVFQDYGLFPWLTVADNIAYGPRQRRLPKERVAEVTARFMSMVKLDKFRDRYPHQLSGGMQQRVAIARVLANDPAVLLMDEPFGALDSLTREQMQQDLRGVVETLAPTVVLVTHSVEEAVFLADRVVVMTGGPNHGVPGHIAKIVPVPIAHPRDVTAPAFNDLKRELLAAIHSSPTGAVS